MGLRILLADDHAVLREGLRALIEKNPHTVVVGEAADGAEAVRLAGELQPDVVVMDLTMPIMNGIDAIRTITGQYPDIRILALSMESDRAFVVEALKAGALGYLLKDSAFAEIAGAIDAVASGETFLPQKISALIVKEFLHCIPTDMSTVYEVLTTREKEILRLIADGGNTKEIASRYGTSIKTVENQRNAIMKKLNLFSIAELTKFAVRSGFSSLNR